MALPRDALPAKADNPHGYCESREIVRFNNRLLESAGTRWNDDSPIASAWFADPARAAEHEEALALLEASFGDADRFVLKDPRLCRLLPFWTAALGAAGIGCAVVQVLRDPLEVALSLAARQSDPEFRPAAVLANSRALLLWLRYVLDAERHSRCLQRVMIDAAQLIAEPHVVLEDLEAIAQTGLRQPAEAIPPELAELVEGDLYRQRALEEPGAPSIATGLERLRRLRCALLATGARADEHVARSCDALHAALDRLVRLYAPLRKDADPLDSQDAWSQSILGQLSVVDAPPLHPARR